MTTKTTAIGPNSAAINYSINSTRLEVLDAVEAFIITKGWVLFDAAAGTNTRMYRALNADQTTHKYMSVNVNNASYLITEVYESWNADAHTGTNRAYTSDVTSEAQRLTLTYSGYIYIFATARWCIFQTRLNDGFIGSATGQSWSGCIEIARDNPDETPGDFPIYAWSNGYRFLGFGATSSYPECFSLPRTIGNETGATGQYPSTVSTLAGATWNSTARLFDMLPEQSNPLSDTDDIFVLTPFAVNSNRHSAQDFNIRGRFFGIKILSRNLGSLLDKITIKCDADVFYSPNGTDTEHHILTTSNNARFAIPS